MMEIFPPEMVVVRYVLWSLDGLALVIKIEDPYANRIVLPIVGPMELFVEMEYLSLIQKSVMTGT